MVLTNPMGAGMMAHARGRPIGKNPEMHMALTTHRWTRADLERLPDDGNRYEAIRGELVVSSVPAPRHAALVEALRAILEPYCRDQQLGNVSENQAFVHDDDEVIPDLVVRAPLTVPPPADWDDAPMPLLVVEVLSPSSRRNDRVLKSAFYIEGGVPEYWIVNGDARSITVVTNAGSTAESARLHWQPAGRIVSLDIDVVKLFTTALG
jgi:Uma2 family endonuclease